MGMNTLPACPTMPLSSQQTCFLNHCRSWHHSDCTLLQFCHLVFPVPQHAACCPLLSSTQPRGTEGILLLHPRAICQCLEGLGSEHRAQLGWKDPNPKDCAFGWPWSHCFPPQRSWNGQKSCQRQPTTTGLYLPSLLEGEIYRREERRTQGPAACLQVRQVGHRALQNLHTEHRRSSCCQD